jgi:hypothetical protein
MSLSYRRIVMVGGMVLLATGLMLASWSPALAYGKANWQVTFSGTGPGFGFWGWCDFAGATTWSPSGLPTSGTTGDCQFSEYLHMTSARGTCEVSVDLADEAGQPAWQVEPSVVTGTNDFFFSGTMKTHPVSETAFCENIPGSPPSTTFSNFDSFLPVHPGHLNASGFFGTTELQIQETVIR